MKAVSIPRSKEKLAQYEADELIPRSVEDKQLGILY
jgi:hypothetical protein